MPYEQVKKSEELQLVEIILNKVYGSLDEISMEKKIKDFDLMCFKEDLKTFIDTYNSPHSLSE
jgi:hypothetical protein